MSQNTALNLDDGSDRQHDGAHRADIQRALRASEKAADGAPFPVEVQPTDGERADREALLSATGNLHIAERILAKTLGGTDVVEAMKERGISVERLVAEALEEANTGKNVTSIAFSRAVRMANQILREKRMPQLPDIHKVSRQLVEEFQQEI
ncbi:hypothetical protein HZA43_04110 [Candidatus Peregrinibacteria bacterium]|nr:hypothetical protein [Candidatus Peregrinibacteria bacterium]